MAINRLVGSGSRSVRRLIAGGIAAALCLAAAQASAEVSTVRFARQLGLGYLQLYVAEDLKLVEKHAKEAGLGDVTATYAPLGSPSAVNDALLSGSADLAAAGIEVPEVLKGEIPRLVQLRAEFPAAARAGLRASLDAVAESEGTMGLIGNFLRVQTGARSVEPREGSDPDAILSRANAAVEAGAIATALDEIATLPQSGQNAMKSWTDRARIWVDANTALAELAAGGR